MAASGILIITGEGSIDIPVKAKPGLIELLLESEWHGPAGCGPLDGDSCGFEYIFVRKKHYIRFTWSCRGKPRRANWSAT